MRCDAITKPAAKLVDDLVEKKFCIGWRIGSNQDGTVVGLFSSFGQDRGSQNGQVSKLRLTLDRVCFW